MSSAGTRRCLLLFARSPRDEERAKRLPGAGALFAAALRRLTSALPDLPGVAVVVATPSAELPVLPPGAHRLAQHGLSFGERLRNAFADARALGYDQVVAVPTDVPALGAREIAVAFSHLEAAPIVLGPSPDGGVYLIGVHADGVEALLANVPWRTPEVLTALRRNCPDAVILAPLADVDRRRDLDVVRASGTDTEIAALIDWLLRAPGDPRRSIARAPLPRHLCLPRSSGRAPPSPARATSIPA